jgi:hypothetical protein
VGFARPVLCVAIASAVLLCLGTNVGRLFGQSFEAQLTGVVKDQSGAVIPGAQLTATNLATHTSYSAVSNGEGIYRFPSLPPAEYRVSCSMNGFKRFEQGHITLQVAQVFELNISLQPGEMTEQITITAAPPPLETESATLGQVVTTRSVQNLPLNIRDPMALVALTPGVILGTNFGNGGGNDVGRNFFKSDFNVGGGRSGSQEILMDGAPDTTPDINRGVINPPVDSVQEFKVQAQSFDAQFGRTSGGIVNVITKSGTDAYHGLAYDFERHSVLDANNWFNNANGRANPSFQRHQFGGNLGGPILKGKWFAFGDYEGLRQGYPQTTLSTVPTPLQRQGDFSQTFTSTGALIRVYDPASVVTLPDGTRQRSPFTGNAIPASRFSRVAQAALDFIPLPNLPGNPITGQNNYIYSADSVLNSNKYDLRTDANFSESTRMFVRFSRQEDTRSVPGTLPLPAGGGRYTTDHYSQAVADLTHVFSPTLVGNIQFAFTRALAAQFGASQGFDLSKLNLPAAYTSIVAPQFPVFNIGDVTGTSNGSDSFTQFQPRNVWSTLGSVTWQHGKHSIKFGADWRMLHFNEGQNSSASGTFAFGRQFTQGPNPVQGSSTSGYGLASFLLGDVSSSSAFAVNNSTGGIVNAINPISTQGLYYATYVQDDWKVTDRLTLNIGLRWDVGIGDREKYNRLAYFDPGYPNPLGTVPGLPNVTGALRWIGQENPQNQQATDWLNFGPRFGFAYKLDDKTVLRGGYGIFFLPRNIQGNGDGAVEAVRTTNMVSSLDNVNPYNTLDNPFPQGILPPLNDRDPLANVGSSIAAPEHSFRNGYSQTWSFGVQRELPWGLVLDAHYWGSKSTRLQVSWNINQLPDQYLALGSRLNDSVANPFFGIITNGALSAPTTTRQQLFLPFPQYTAITQVFVPAANSTYEAGTLQLEKRLSTSLTFLAAYTRSKGIDDVRTPNDYYNRRLEKGLSGFDAPNQFRFSGVWNLPFGHGRAFGKDSNVFLNAVLGGWDLSGIITIQSGFPVAISRTANNNGRSAALDNPTLSRWFDTTAFTIAPAFTYGSVGPVLPDVRTDPVRNVDAVLVKNFTATIGDHPITTQFRSEFYNLFNHPQFATPNGTITSQSFGQVTAQANSPRDLQFGLKVSF